MWTLLALEFGRQNRQTSAEMLSESEISLNTFFYTIKKSNLPVLIWNDYCIIIFEGASEDICRWVRKLVKHHVLGDIVARK